MALGEAAFWLHVYERVLNLDGMWVLSGMSCFLYMCRSRCFVTRMGSNQTYRLGRHHQLRLCHLQQARGHYGTVIAKEEGHAEEHNKATPRWRWVTMTRRKVSSCHNADVL